MAWPGVGATRQPEGFDHRGLGVEPGSVCSATAIYLKSRDLLFYSTRFFFSHFLLVSKEDGNITKLVISYI